LITSFGKTGLTLVSSARKCTGSKSSVFSYCRSLTNKWQPGFCTNCRVRYSIYAYQTTWPTPRHSSRSRGCKV